MSAVGQVVPSTAGYERRTIMHDLLAIGKCRRDLRDERIFEGWRVSFVNL